jgi:uncharacterized protein YqgC (DUF456 family)
MPPVSIVLLVVFFVAGLLEARRFAERYGRSPWGWSPVFWGLVLGLVWPIGLVLLAIAERVGRAQAKTRMSPQSAVHPIADRRGPGAIGENILPKP